MDLWRSDEWFQSDFAVNTPHQQETSDPKQSSHPGMPGAGVFSQKKNANQARFVRSRKKFYGKHGWGIHTPLPRSFKSCRKLRRSEQQMSKKKTNKQQIIPREVWATAAGQGSGSGRATNPFNRCSTNVMQWLNGFAIPIAIECICGAVTSERSPSQDVRVARSH